MTVSTVISHEDILEEIKLSCKIPEITEQIMLRRIMQHEAEKAGIQVEVNELQEAADDFRARNRLTSAKNTQLWLNIHQLSLDEFESIIHLELLTNKLKNVILKDQVEKYFYQHQLDFDQVALYEVVLESKELATELYYAIREGEIRFQDVASQYINNVEIRRKGGYLGQIKRKDLNQELLSIFSVTSFPEIIKPIVTSRGYHLIWVETIIKAELNEEVYRKIKNQLFEDFAKEKLGLYFM